MKKPPSESAPPPPRLVVSRLSSVPHAYKVSGVVLNQVSRYHLCILAMQRATRLHHLVPPFIQECNDLLTKHHSYVRTNFEDMRAFPDGKKRGS